MTKKEKMTKINHLKELIGKTVTVHAPGTVANLVCGFDVMGLCLNEPYDVMKVKMTEERGVTIINNSTFDLPLDPGKNTAGEPLLRMVDSFNADFGFEVTITKNIKPGSGIGSSAVSAAGAVVAANHLLNNKYSKQELVDFAMFGEEIASGGRHADNIAPCIYGGVTLIRSTEPLDIICIPAPSFFITIVHPQIEVKTSYARSILPKEVPLKAAIEQWGNVGALVAGFYSNDVALIGRSLKDVIVEPVRSKLIPGYDEIKQKSLEAGALGGGISGAGPSMFMISSSEEIAYKIAGIMKAIFRDNDIDSNTYVTTINNEGVRVV
jgi:homoserine kinase